MQPNTNHADHMGAYEATALEANILHVPSFYRERVTSGRRRKAIRRLEIPAEALKNSW